MAPPLPANTTASSAPTRERRRRIWRPCSAPSAWSMPASSARTPCSTGSRWACWTMTSAWPSCCKRYRASATATTSSPRWRAWPLATIPSAGRAKIRRDDGFLRLVWGLGTRAVDRVSNDYPRMVALSHPDLRPEIGAAKIRRYSQHFVDLINLRENQFETRPVADLLTWTFRRRGYLVSVDRGDYLQQPPAYDPSLSPRDLVLTFDNLLDQDRICAVDEEHPQDDLASALTATWTSSSRPISCPAIPQPEFAIHLLQCRPQASREQGEAFQMPTTVAEADILFTADRLVPQRPGAAYPPHRLCGPRSLRSDSRRDNPAASGAGGRAAEQAPGGKALYLDGAGALGERQPRPGRQGHLC